MDKLRSMTQTAGAAVKERIPFISGDSDSESATAPGTPLEPYYLDERVKRYREIKTGKFVKAETALGIAAVAQVVRPPTPRQSNKVSNKSAKSKSKSSKSSTVNQPKNKIFGPKLEEIDLEALWNGSGDREDIARKIMATDPILYLKYVSARDTFIISEANARGAGISDSAKKTSLLGWLRRNPREYFRKDDRQAQTQPEEFSTVYNEALQVALASYGNLSPEEQYERRLELEADAGYALEWDVSKKKIESSGDKKFSLSRKAAIAGGMLVAGGLGAATGIWERVQKGEHDLRFLGLAAVFGAAAGFGAAKSYQPTEDDSTAAAHAEEAREAVRLSYDKDSPDTIEEKAIGIESVKSVTKRDKRKALGRTALGIGGGALVGAGGHLLIDMWPTLAHYRLASVGDSPVMPETSVDPTIDVSDINTPDVPDAPNTPEAPQQKPESEVPAVTPEPSVEPTNDVSTTDTSESSQNEVEKEARTVIPDPSVDPANDTGPADTANTPESPPQEVEREILPIEQEPTEKPAQDIYIEPGSSITNEFYQYIYDSHGVDLSDNQLNHMYMDLIESGHYTPEQLFSEVDFYTMDDGRWGMKDIGSAELTGVGRGAIDDWIAANIAE